jgi:putative aldouronate transport system permease protein
MQIPSISSKTAIKTIKKNTLKRRMQNYWQVYVLMSVGIVYYLLFKMYPLWGLATAFVDYDPISGILASKFVGLKFFKDFIMGSNFLKILRNTLAISLMDLFFSFPAPIILSILLNEIRHEKFKRITQSIIYMPHFLSWVVIAGLTFFMLSADVGVVNKFIMSVGGEPISFLINQNGFWWMLLGQNIWKEVGWGTIVYLAAISQIDQCLYEAAIVDGASRFRQVLHITIPCIIPTIIVLFLMRLGRMMDVSFEQVWMMSNDMVREVAETFETYSFRVGVQIGNYSLATSIGLFKSIIGLGLVILSNWMIKKTGHEGIY